MHPAIQMSGYWQPIKHRRLPPHYNNGLEIIYIPRGRQTWQVDGRLEEIAPNSVFFTLPWQVHGTDADLPGVELYFVIVLLDQLYESPVRSFGFHPTLQLDPTEAQRLSRHFTSVPNNCFPATAALKVLIQELHHAAHSTVQTPANDLLQQSLTTALLAELEQCSAPNNRRAPSDFAHRRVGEFLSVLQNNCEEAWTLPHMASRCQLRRTMFSEICKELTGDSPITYLNRSRVNRSQQLLRETTMTISEVAFDCGFTSSQYFARVFRQFSDMTPGEYRDAHPVQSKPLRHHGPSR